MHKTHCPHIGKHQYRRDHSCCRSSGQWSRTQYIHTRSHLVRPLGLEAKSSSQSECRHPWLSSRSHQDLVLVGLLHVRGARLPLGSLHAVCAFPEHLGMVEGCEIADSWNKRVSICTHLRHRDHLKSHTFCTQTFHFS